MGEVFSTMMQIRFYILLSDGNILTDSTLQRYENHKVLESLGEHEVKPWSEIQAVHLSAPVWRNQISCFCFFMYHSQATDCLRLFYVVEGHAIFLSFHLRFAVCYFFTMLSKDNSGNFWLNENITSYLVFLILHTSWALTPSQGNDL